MTKDGGKKKRDAESARLASLRLRAEKALKDSTLDGKEPSSEETRHLIHELSVYQIELEMQNDELRRTQIELEESRDRYSDLYNFAPVGYFTLDKNGLILESNLTAAQMLGRGRALYIKKPFALLVAREDRDTFYICKNAVLEKKTSQACELKLLRKDKTEFYAHLECEVVKETIEDSVQIRMAVIDVTERKKTEEALRESEEKYRLITESSVDGIYQIDLSGKFVFINEAFAKIFGYTREELLGKDFTFLAEEKNISEAKKLFKNVLLSDTSARDEFTFKDKKGRNRIAYYSATTLKNDGQVIGLTGILRDITKRKEAEAALAKRTHELGERVKELNCLYTVSQLIADPDCTLKSVLQGTVDLIPPSWQYPEITCARITFKGEDFKTTKWKTTKWIQSADIIAGKEKVGIIDVAYLEERPEIDEGPFLIEERKLIDGLAIILGDFIERKHVEELRRESDEKYRLIAETSVDGIYHADISGNFVFLNEACARIFGYTRKELEGKHFSTVLNEEKMPAVEKIFHEIISGKKVTDVLNLFNKLREPITVYFSASPMKKDGEITGLSGIIRDVTERKKAEEELKDSHQRLLTILDGIDALVYVTDMQSYELLFVNKYGRDVWGDIAGRICWQTLQEGQTGPCAFCTNKYLVDKAGNPKGPYEWEFQNTVNNRWYFIIDRAIEWLDGRIVRLEIATDITERKQAVDDLELFKDLINRSNDAIFVIDPDTGKFLNVNDMACKNLGYIREELLKMTVTNIEAVLPDDYSWKGHVEEVRKKGFMLLEGYHKRKDGTTFPVEVNIKYVSRENKNYMVAVARDIAERKKAEEERTALLDISQNITKTLDLKKLLDIAVKKTAEAVDVDRISVILIDHDEKGTYQTAFSRKGKKISSSKVIDIYDYSKLQEAIRKKRAIYVPDARDKKNQSQIDIELAKKLNIGSGVHIPLLFKSRVVGVINFIAVGGAKEFQEHEIEYYETIANQLSAMIANAELYEEIKQAKRNLEKLVGERTHELSKSEEKYRSLVESQDDTIFVVDSKGNFIFMNKGGSEMTGYSIEELMGFHFSDLIAPENHEKITGQFKRHLNDPTTYRYETQILTKTGKKLDIEVVTTPLLDEGKTVAIQGIARDITEPKKAREEMKRRLMKFKLEDGNIYLVKEHLPTLSREVFKDLLNVGYKGLVLSRTPEKEFRKAVEGEYEFMWLAERDGRKTLSPKADKIEKMTASLPSKCDILIDRLDYLITKNGFNKTLTLIQRLREHAYAGDHVITLSIDPSVLRNRELRLLEKETMEVEQRLAGKLPEDLLEILKFVYSQNRMGVKPTYKSVGQELDQSQPTVRKKIRQLESSGYLREFSRGNSKVVELRERGRGLFFK
jgi:PAS domain S-box-containing protein